MMNIIINVLGLLLIISITGTMLEAIINKLYKLLDEIVHYKDITLVERVGLIYKGSSLEQLDAIDYKISCGEDLGLNVSELRKLSDYISLERLRIEVEICKTYKEEDRERRMKMLLPWNRGLR